MRSPETGVRPRILVISFSRIVSDSRVLRQLSVLREFGEVTTVGYGPAPDGIGDHREIAENLPSLPQTPLGVLALVVRSYARVATAAPALRAARDLIGEDRFHLVVADEARALPLAIEVARDSPTWCDLHEWAPEERSHVLSWRLLVSPFMTWLCGAYLPRAAALTTVNRSIADLYEARWEVRVEVLRNAAARVELSPSPVDPGHVRLVHSGGAVPGRNLEALIDATLALGDRFTLDFYLLPARDGGRYLRQLEQRAAGSSRIRFHPAVAPADLPRTLNAYDMGVFALPSHTLNHRFMLPNKIFDFIQARIAVCMNSAPETDRVIEEYGVGVSAPGTTADDLITCLRSLDAETLRAYKAASHRAADILTAEREAAVQRSIVTRLLTARL